MRKCIIIATIWIVVPTIIRAQPTFERFDSIRVYKSAQLLKFPWAGGLNFTEWNMLDVNNDGVKDAIVFDKSGEKIRVFVHDGTTGQANYRHAPEYQEAFPEVIGFLVFLDYNGDGKEDLFTYSFPMGGTKVYKNTSLANNLQFTLEKTLLLSDRNPGGTPNISNIPASSVAIPGISDLDNDGDLDILTFSTSGVQIEYHKNMSQELYGHSDSLVFDFIDACWGDLLENSCTTLLNYCPFPKMYLEAIGDMNPERNSRHAGSCIMCFDADADNDKDVIMGDFSCDSIVYYHNSGNNSNAHIDVASKAYPPSKPIQIKQFPCTYFVDINNDGKRDLIASPNITASENYKSVWYFNNTGTDQSPIFNFNQDNFLQDEMIELGEGAYPTGFDYDGDGDLDLLVGNFGYYSPPSIYTTKMALFENTGTLTNPQFTLINDNFNNLASSFSSDINRTPSMSDLDNDGDMDMIIGGQDGRLRYYTNTAPGGFPASFTLSGDFASGCVAGIDAGQFSYPQIYDLDKDGKKDLVIGNYRGLLKFYKNNGSITSPSFPSTPTIDTLGDVFVNEYGYAYGNSTPFLLEENNTTYLYVGSERGYLYLYGNIDNNLNGSFALIDSILMDKVEGEQVAPFIADWNGDGKKDLMLGNYSGGLSFFRGIGTVGIENNPELITQFTIFPNPAIDLVYLNFSPFNLSEKTIYITDMLGKPLITKTVSDNSISIDVSHLPDGMYFIEVRIKTSQSIFKKAQKIIIQH